MYDLDLHNNELIKCVDENAILKINDKNENVIAILTNFRIIILKDTKYDIDYKSILHSTKNIYYPSEYEKILALDINKISNIKLIENSFIKYTLFDTNYFILKSERIKNEITPK